eukprot:TRINITY_DN46031_c0_g2_i1.p1 TRINITY_DN46031_c0_g2~~TRINITY_DN46031_c0_g2_i1.p1  ORF type:complete len:203 (-),score=54.67 TRINITY_DN46031_c0_g2_i1:128-736(-)
MGPRSDGSDVAEESAPASASSSSGRRIPQNPQVLRAAYEIVKRKKAEALDKEDYEEAAKFHKQLQELEGQLHLLEGKEGSGSRAESSSAPSSMSALKRKAAAAAAAASKGGDGAADALVGSDTVEKRPWWRPRSLFAAPNPTRTIELLKQSGYSSKQAYALLVLLYVVVFCFEVLLLYAGWSVLSKGSVAGEDGGDELYEEF